MCSCPVKREISSHQAVINLELWLREHNIHSSLSTPENNLVATVEFFNSTGKPFKPIITPIQQLLCNDVLSDETGTICLKKIKEQIL
ncbi:hypothetical protein TW84_01385 [Vibrio neptunius]|nr:hypothetical protein TW84_01385 [Vibrio neptunius]